MDLVRGPVIAGLLEVDPGIWTGTEGASLRSCDICSCTLIDDPPMQWRTFYYDPEEGLSVCEKCVQAYLEGEPCRAVP